jgi:hypothetical protein
VLAVVGLPTIEVVVVEVGEDEVEDEEEVAVGLEKSHLLRRNVMKAEEATKAALILLSTLVAIARILLELVAEQLLHHLPKKMENLVRHRTQSQRSIAFS